MATYRVNNNLDKNIFRAYDIRGIVGIGIDADTFYTLGLVLSSEILANNEDTVIVGRDGRLSSPELSEALIQGLCDGGCNVNFIGEVPSPVLYFSTYKLGIKSGLMLTGSHNPKNYNGLKMMLSGKTLSEGAIQDLYNKSLLQQQPSGPKGSIKEVSVNELYQDDIINRVQLSRRLKVVVDCGNGAAGIIAPKVFQALGCNVVSLYSEVDGNFPSHHPNPSVPENLLDLQQAVKEHNADIGLAFDGDADRIGVVADNEKIIWPDRLMMLYSQDILQRIPGANIVFDVKCSSFLADVINECGGNPIQWRTGHSVLKAKMIATGAAIAGEMSGHIFFRDNWYGFDDGIYAGVRLLEILADKDSSSSEIFNQLPEGINTPEILVAIPEEEKFVFIESLISKASFPGAVINTIDGLRVNFRDGWALVRASNTTPALTLRFEAVSKDRLYEIQEQIFELMKSVESSIDFKIFRESTNVC
jgi:phosphomannomutase/phosphoglucomutase